MKRLKEKAKMVYHIKRISDGKYYSKDIIKTGYDDEPIFEKGKNAMRFTNREDCLKRIEELAHDVRYYPTIQETSELMIIERWLNIIFTI